jgi:hypothetical protein
MTDTAMHPSSLAALVCSAEAHELAAAVLRTRNPSASTAHADLAHDFRVKAERATPVPAG